MINQPDLSLITSLFRSERYLPRYVQAVLRVARECSNLVLQLILVANDASPRERTWIARLQNDARTISNLQIVPLFVTRETLYASWNRGVRASAAECIGFWNVDDVRNAEALREAREVIHSGADFVYFPFPVVVQNKHLFSYNFSVYFPSVPQFNRAEFTRGMFVGPFFIFRRSLYDRIGPFDEQFRIVGDFDWAVRAAKIVDFVLGRSIGGVFTSDGRGLSAQVNPRHAAENNIVYLRHGALDKLQPARPALMRQYRVEFGSTHVDIPQEIAEKLFADDGTASDDYWDENWMRQKQVEFIKTKIKRAPRKLARVVAGAFGR